VKRLAILVAALALAACDDTNVHLLYGQQYEPQNKCMLPEQSIDVLSGPDPGESCAPVCIKATVLDAQDYVYITTTCPPYDPYPSEKQTGYHSPSDPCTPAFAAYAANIECGPDGGPPEGGLDAGSDAEAGTDATVDAGSDAAADGPSDAQTDAGTAETGPEAASDSALE
jgi:hypothetical protein